MDNPASVGAPGAGGLASGMAPPRRGWWARMAPGVVGGLMVALVAASAWEALRPVTDVRVGQALPVSGGAPEPAPSSDPGAIRARATASVQASGWVEAAPYSIACPGLADGVVESVLVLEGDRVERGQVIARLIDADAALGVRRAESRHALAAAALASARAELAAAQTTWDEPFERERSVAVASEALARARVELEQLPHLIAAERALLEQIEAELAGSRAALAGGGAVEIETTVLAKRAAAQHATVEATVLREGMLRADVSAREAEHRSAVRGAALRVEELRALESARAGVAQAEAEVGAAEAERDEARLRLERMEVRAPIAGVVQRRLVGPGMRIMASGDDPAGAIVATLYDPEQLQVRVDVPLADAGKIVLGQACEIVLDILPDATLAGVVTLIGHEANIQKNTLEVKVRIVDPPTLLRPEMLARVKFVADPPGGGSAAGGGGPQSVDTPEAVLVRPEVLDGQGEVRRVWVVRGRRGDRGVARVESVRVVGERDGWTLVAGAIRAGDMLVESPGSLADGAMVRVRLTGNQTEGRP